MNIKKIIKEEVNDFDWTDDIGENDFKFSELAKDFLEWEKSDFVRLHIDFDGNHTWSEHISDGLKISNPNNDVSEMKESGIYGWFINNGITSRDDMFEIVKLAYSYD